MPEAERTLPRGWRAVSLAALYVASYVALDALSYVYPLAPLGITPWNPPPGLSLFLLLRFGLRFMPALFVAAALADILVRGAPAGWPALLASSALIAGGYGAAAYLLRERLRLRIGLDSARDLGLFVVTMALASLAVALMYVGLHTALGVVRPAEFGQNVTRYWIGDLDGILVLAPVLLAHAPRRPPRRVTRGEWVEYGLQAAALAAALWGFVLLATSYGFIFFSLLFLPLTWIAARLGLRGATIALAALQLGLIGLIKAQVGIGADFLQLQAAMLVLCVTGLALGAAVSHRVRVEADLREKQASLNQALRFAAAGEMTSALAHELNQPIAALSNYLGASQLLARAPGESGRLEQTLDKAVVEAHRAGEVIHRIRDFFRRGAVRPQPVSATRMVEDVIAAARRRTEQAAIQVRIDAQPVPETWADSLQVESAIQNVLHNAIDALQTAPPGERRIDVRVGRAPGGIEVVIADNGPGIAPDIAPHLFEPFHSSRAEGMGLGLAISRTLLRANGGEVRWEAGAARGARFVIFLPLREPSRMEP